MIVNISKSTNRVVDIGQSYDLRFFDNVTVADGTIPPGENPMTYSRLGDGSIVKMDQAELDATYPQELFRRLRTEFQTLRDQLIADVSALPSGTQKQIIVNLLQLLRLMARLTRLE